MVGRQFPVRLPDQRAVVSLSGLGQLQRKHLLDERPQDVVRHPVPPRTVDGGGPLVEAVAAVEVAVAADGLYEDAG